MSISLNNHESRIKVLENKSGGTIIESKLANPGFVKFSNGIIMNFGYKGTKIEHVTFPKPYTTTPVIVASSRTTNTQGYSDVTIYDSITTTGFRIGFRTQESRFQPHWLAIGYLISNSIRSLLGGGLRWL